MAMMVASSSTSQPGRASESPVIMRMMVQLVSAPTMSTSPCAKLMRPMMPYTIVYPSATSAYILPRTRPLMICCSKTSMKFSPCF